MFSVNNFVVYLGISALTAVFRLAGYLAFAEFEYFGNVGMSLITLALTLSTISDMGLRTRLYLTASKLSVEDIKNGMGKVTEHRIIASALSTLVLLLSIYFLHRSEVGSLTENRFPGFILLMISLSIICANQIVADHFLSLIRAMGERSIDLAVRFIESFLFFFLVIVFLMVGGENQVEYTLYSVALLSLTRLVYTRYKIRALMKINKQKVNKNKMQGEFNNQLTHKFSAKTLQQGIATVGFNVHIRLPLLFLPIVSAEHLTAKVFIWIYITQSVQIFSSSVIEYVTKNVRENPTVGYLGGLKKMKIFLYISFFVSTLIGCGVEYYVGRREGLELPLIAFIASPMLIISYDILRGVLQFEDDSIIYLRMVLIGCVTFISLSFIFSNVKLSAIVICYVVSLLLSCFYGWSYVYKKERAKSVLLPVGRDDDS